MRTLSEIAERRELPCPETASHVVIAGVNTLANAKADELSFLGSVRYLHDFAKTHAAAVLVQKNVQLPAETRVPVLAVDNADLAILEALKLFMPPPQPIPGVDPSARVANTAAAHSTVAIGNNVVIGERTKIGRNSVLHAGVFVGDDVTLGEDCQIFPNVVIRERITIGNRVIIHAGSVLGSDGFGYSWDGKQHAKTPHIGTVIIEDDVGLGSCTCIDRAQFSSTRVGPGSKIDNQVQTAHNCQIGPLCIIAGQSALAGSVTLGAGVVMAGQAGVRDHVKIGDGAVLGAHAAVMYDVAPGKPGAGVPAQTIELWAREQAALRHLSEFMIRVRTLTDRVDRLENSLR